MHAYFRYTLTMLLYRLLMQFGDYTKKEGKLFQLSNYLLRICLEGQQQKDTLETKGNKDFSRQMPIS